MGRLSVVGLTRLVLGVGLFVLLSSVAVAQSRPLQVCIAKSGTIAAKQRCAKGEQQLSLNSIRSVAVASQGPAGPAGPAGTVDPNRCVTRSQFYSGVNYVVGRASCLNGEFLLTHGITTSSVYNDIISVGLLYYPGQNFASGVEYETGVDGGGGSIAYSMSVAAVCCRP